MNPEAWPDFFLSVALRSVLLAGAGALFYLAVRRGSNRLRFASALTGIASLALLPLILGLVPRFEWAIASQAAGVGGSTAAFDPRWGLVVLWFAGSAWFLFRLVQSSAAAHRLRSESAEFLESSASQTLLLLKQRLGLRTPVGLAFSSDLSRPVVCGLFRPVILLPPQAIDWSPARMECVLAHELAHVARLDLWSQWLCQTVAAFYWFNPLVWKLAAWQVREREIAADELALSITGDNRSGYARELLAIATEPSAARSISLQSAAAMLGATSRLEDRISCLFGAATPGNKPPGRVASTLACASALTLFVACTACDPVVSPEKGSWTDDEVRLRLTADPFPAN